MQSIKHNRQSQYPHQVQQLTSNMNIPIIRSTGDVPADGTAANNGQKSVHSKNKMPHVTLESPVLAPALIPGADSGDIIIGPEPINADIKVPMPQAA